MTKKGQRSKGSKGDKELEKIVEAWLELEGWKTHRAAAVNRHKPGGGTFSVMHDIFGVFDILAVRPLATDGHPNLWAVQMTVPQDVPEHRRKIDAAGPWPPELRISMISHQSARIAKETCHWLVFEDLRSDGWSQPYKREVDLSPIRARRSANHAAKKAASALKRHAKLIRVKGAAARRERGLCNVTGCENPFLWGVAYMGTGAVVCDEHYQSDFGGEGGTKVEPAAASMPLWGEVTQEKEAAP